MKALVKALILASLPALAGCRPAAEKVVQAGPLSVTLSIHPDPPIASDNRLRVVLRDAQGRPVDGAAVHLAFDMPAMGAMAEMKGEGESRPLGGGRYDVDYTLPMDGEWAITLEIAAPQTAPQRIELKVSPPRAGFVLLGGAAAPANARSMAAMPGMPGLAGGAAEPAAGRPSLSLPIERQQLIGVTTGAVEERPLVERLRATGVVRVDERSLADVTLRYEAFVEKLFVAETGKRVAVGQPLLTVYSPDLLSAEQELLDVERGGGRASALVAAARKRLRFWDLTASQIADLERRAAADGTVVIHAPIAGVVLEKDVVEGTHVQPGMVLYRLGNLGHLIWIEAEMYESDAPFVAVGEPATASLPALGGAPYQARVTFVAPTVDEKTRTLTARLELANPSLALKPGMYADVEIGRPLGTRLAVPDSALILTGEHRYVFVERAPGRLEPVEVRVGAQAGDYDEVLSGLRRGDRVVTSGTFLVASEAQLRGVFAHWSDGGLDGGGR